MLSGESAGESEDGSIDCDNPGGLPRMTPAHNLAALVDDTHGPLDLDMPNAPRLSSQQQQRHKRKTADSFSAPRTAGLSRSGADMLRKLGSTGKKSNDYAERPNSHPVYYTGVVFDRRRLGLGPKDCPEGLYTPECPLYVPSPIGDALPESWAPSEEIPAELFLRADGGVYTLFLPSYMLSSMGQYSLRSTNLDHRAFGMSWNFIVKAITTGKIGPRNANLSSHHLFRAADGRVLPKIEVYGEPIVAQLGEKLNAYISERQVTEGEREYIEMYSRRAQLTVGETERLNEWIAGVIAEVSFRKKLMDRENFLGIRYWIVVNAKKLDFGRAIQRRLWRNAVGCGDVSAAAVCARQQAIEEKWKKKVDEAVKARKEGKDAPQGFDLNDTGPVVADDVAASAAAAEQEEEDDKVLNGKDGDANEEKDAQKQQRKQQRESDKKTRIMCGVLGLNSARKGTKDPNIVSQTFLQKIKDRRRQLYPHLYENTRGGSGRQSHAGGGGGADRITDLERGDLIGFANEREIPKVGITNLATAVKIAYRHLLNLNTVEPCPALAEFLDPENDEDRRKLCITNLLKDISKAADESLDMGDFDHPYHPGKWFNFDTMNACWGLNKKACREQTSAANYIKPCDLGKGQQQKQPNGDDNAAGEGQQQQRTPNRFDCELQFPAPSLVWQLSPPDGFKTKKLSQLPPFWTCDPFIEKMLESTRLADAADEAAEFAARKAYDNRAVATDTSGSNLTEEEIRANAAFKKSRTYASIVRANEKYEKDPWDKPKSSATDRMMMAMGHQSAEQAAIRAAQEVVIQDVMSDMVDECRKQEMLVNAAAERRPIDAKQLNKYWMNSVFENKFKPMMLTNAQSPGRTNPNGLNDIHKLHVAYLSEGGTSNPSLFMPHCGFENLTYRGGLIAEKLLEYKVLGGLTNSVDVLWLMSACINPSAYRATRRIALHLMKIGPPGSGKSHIDDVFKAMKVQGTAVDSLHSTTMSKFVETPTCDRVLMEDEASSKVIGDTAKATNTTDHTALTLHKAWLSNDYLGFTVFEVREGQRVQIRKRVAARGCHCTNANIQQNVTDTSIYDRYFQRIVVPYLNVSAAQMDMLRSEQRPQLKKSAKEWATRQQLLDRLQFGVCKMIDLGAAKVNITDCIMQLMMAMPRLRRYGISNDPSLRRIPQILELATCTTITMAILDAFSGPYAVTMQHGEINGQDAVIGERQWREDFMKVVRKRLFCTADVTPYVLSQGYRSLIGDYLARDLVSFYARVYCGYFDGYFDKLFNEHAWEIREERGRDPVSGETITVQKPVQKFPFTDIRLYVNEASNRKTLNDIDLFVRDNERTKRQWELMGYKARGMSRNNSQTAIDLQILAFPLFLCWREGIEGQTAYEHQDDVSRYVDAQSNKRKAPPAGNTTGIVGGIMHNISDKGKSAPPRPPQRQRINPNKILVPGGLSAIVKATVSDLSAVAFKHSAVDEYALKFMMTRAVVVCPVLEEMNEITDELKFKMITTPDGKQEVVVRTLPIMAWEDFSHDLFDPYVPPLFISFGNQTTGTLGAHSRQASTS